LKILYLVHQFFPKYYYGTERFTLNLAEQMQRLGHNPLVMTYDRGQGQEGYVRLHNNVLVRKYSYHTVPVISFKKTHSPKFHEILDREIEEAYKKLKLTYDIVHICHPMFLSSIARSCKKQGTPIALTLTDPWLLCPATLIDRGFRLCNGPIFDRGCASNCHFASHSMLMARYRQALDVLGMADEIATASRFTASIFQRNGWNKPIRIIPHSIDYKFVKPTNSPANDKITFGYVGSVVWHKGLHILVKAIRNVQAENVNLRIYGSTQESLDYTKELLAIARGDPRIKFLEQFDMETLPDIMKNISAMVVPSVYYDNYPLVTLISLSYRVPVIGSNIGGIPEIIQHGINGFLFEPGNVSELSSLITNLARNPNTIETLRENIVTPRRLEEEALDYENIYMKLSSR
jgi:glycosyltransferase involved in cell wall biosynthesis